MVNLRRYRFVSIIFAFAISVAAIAAPIDLTQFDRMVPQIITSNALGDNDTEMTFADFVAVVPYQMVIETIEQVPIDKFVSGSTNETKAILSFRNNAVTQNNNFERMLSF